MFKKIWKYIVAFFVGLSTAIFIFTRKAFDRGTTPRTENYNREFKEKQQDVTDTIDRSIEGIDKSIRRLEDDEKDIRRAEEILNGED